MGFSEFKKHLITNIAGLILMIIGVIMYVILGIVEFPQEVNGKGFKWVLWLLPMIPISFGSILLFAIDKWVKKVLHISDKVGEKL